MTNIGALFGATNVYGASKITIYLANKDRHNNPVKNIETYISTGMSLLADINGGVTRLPWAEGMWFESDEDDIVADGMDSSRDETTLIYSFIRNPQAFVRRSKELRAFLHKYGRETNQGEVLVEYYSDDDDGCLFHEIYVISEYDTA